MLHVHQYVKFMHLQKVIDKDDKKKKFDFECINRSIRKYNKNI